jgi:predicted transposase/invertase (TIGR01784 family)
MLKIEHWCIKNNQFLQHQKKDNAGHEDGLEQGLKEGREEGDIKATQRERAEALKEKKEMAMATARKLKNKNIAIDIIVEATGLSLKEIEALV